MERNLLQIDKTLPLHSIITGTFVMYSPTMTHSTNFNTGKAAAPLGHKLRGYIA